MDNTTQWEAFLAIVAQETMKHPELRHGQVVFGTLHAFRPEIAELIWNTATDTFHMKNNDLPFKVALKKIKCLFDIDPELIKEVHGE